jgi:Na+-translocating ferredoxin:NAD+ oxidoreductase RnfG subunit
MDTLLIAIAGPIVGLMISMKTTKTITDNQLAKIKELEEKVLIQETTSSELVKKQMGYLSLNERMSFMEHAVKQVDEKQAKKMIALLQPVARTLQDVQAQIGI